MNEREEHSAQGLSIVDRNNLGYTTTVQRGRTIRGRMLTLDVRCDSIQPTALGQAKSYIELNDTPDIVRPGRLLLVRKSR
jgi:hypothetical protein